MRRDSNKVKRDVCWWLINWNMEDHVLRHKSDGVNSAFFLNGMDELVNSRHCVRERLSVREVENQEDT